MRFVKESLIRALQKKSLCFSTKQPHALQLLTPPASRLRRILAPVGTMIELFHGGSVVEGRVVVRGKQRLFLAAP